MIKNYLREKRKEKDISGLELSRRSGVAANIISNIENYRILPYKGWKQKIADALQIPVEEIFPAEEV